jgi:endonuclease
MREGEYRGWLAADGKEAGTVSTSLSYLRRIEAAYGDLDALYGQDGLEGVRSELAYSKTDARNGAPNPSRMAIEGDLYNLLASARTHLNYYARFCDSGPALRQPDPATPPDPVASERLFSMEKDLESALRGNLAQLEAGLRLADGGVQRTVPSGRIDILAEDAQGLVVIELKAVTAPRDAVAQVLAYMGDLAETDPRPVRGILVAPDFDPRASAAARMVPGLRLVRYGFAFTFS